MGGRQSSQNTTPRRHHSETEGRGSVSSLDNNSSQGSFSGSTGLRFLLRSDGLSGEQVVSRRRRRDQNDLLIETHSLPVHLFPAFLSAEIKCPVCNKRIGSDEVESHLQACLAKPKVSYNVDILKVDAGECVICFDDMNAGDRIARLPCLCIYHKKCIDDWFKRNRCCPEHPEEISQDTPSLSTIPETSSNSACVDSERENASQNLTPENYNITQSDTAVDNSIDIAASSSYMGVLSDSSLQNVRGSSPNLKMTCSETENSSNLTKNLNTDNTTNPLNDNLDDLESPTQFANITPSTFQKTVVHVDDGSLHGSSALFDDDELEQLASKIKTILVSDHSEPTISEET